MLWQSYIPYHIAQDVLAHPHGDMTARVQRLAAVALFVDVSGFTVMSEALSTTGRRGTEDLTSLLNAYFKPMIDLIQAYGGTVGRFAGDAMTILFPYTPDTRALVTRRAIHTALAMQQRMPHYAALRTRAGTFSLQMRAGLAGGPVLLAVVGDPAARLEYIIAGAAIDRCAEAEHHARLGEVVIHDDLLAAAGTITLGERRAGFSVVARLHPPALRAPLPPLTLPPEADARAAAFLHPVIAQRIGAGQTSFINEHRNVTVLFIAFDGFDYDHDPQVQEHLQNYFQRVFQVVARYDGNLNKVDTGDKGSKYIVLFGTPVAHEDDGDRALRCALELRALHAETGAGRVRVGVNSGFVFCGQVGSALRQEYTVIGDAVNLAARLMQAAGDGQIVVGDATRQALRTSFAWATSMTITVKGKAEPVQVHLLTGLARRSVLQNIGDLLMIGRATELARLEERLAEAAQRHGQVVSVVGEAGIGKSQLVTTFRRRAEAAGALVYAGEGLSHGLNTSYLIWQDLLRAFFGLDALQPGESAEASNATLIAQVQARLAALHPDLPARLPLLDLALHLPIPDNELTRTLDARTRKEALETLIIACVRATTERPASTAQPHIFILEDCQWMDPLSRDLLVAVGRAIVALPVLIVVVARSPGAERVQEALAALGHRSAIHLAELNATEAEALIALKLAQRFGYYDAPPAGFVQRIIARTQGNPFFLDEMLNLLHARGVDLRDEQAIGSLDLPDSLHNLVLSRIDQLDEGAKTTLKVASVIGRHFYDDWLWNIYEPLRPPERVRTQLALLEQLDLTLLDQPQPEPAHLFKNTVTREVAYESLSVATRTLLHGQIGPFVERTYADNLEQHVDLLAYHYELSQNVEKQREYFRKAGDAAQAAYANAAAIHYYERLLVLLPEREQSGVLLKLGAVWQLTGQWGEAESAYRQALAKAETGDDQRTLAQSQRAIGTLMRLKGSYGDALAWLERAYVVFEMLSDQQCAGEALREIGTVYWSQGDNDAALSYFDQSLTIAQATADQQGVESATNNLGLVYWTLCDFVQALRWFEQAQAIAVQLGDRLQISKVLGNMGNVYQEQGDYVRAFTCHAQNFQLATELGYRLGTSISVGNMGNIYQEQGAYEAARFCHTHALQMALEIGDQPGVALTLWYLALVYEVQQQPALAARLLDLAVAQGRALDLRYELCDFLYAQARLAAQRGLYADAQASNAEAATLAETSEHSAVQFAAQVLAARLRAALDQVPLAEALAEFEQMLEAWRAPHEQAALCYEIWRLDHARAARGQQAATHYAALYQHAPRADYRARYAELTGAHLPEPPALPALPEALSRPPTALAALLVQVAA